MKTEAVVPFRELLSRYTGMDAPAGLVVLSKASQGAAAGPIQQMGHNPDQSGIIPKGAGIYDERGLLPSINGAGLNFIAWA